MTYDSKHVEIFGPQEGYNSIANQYSQYHEHLNSFYHVEFLRFLPRNKKFSIIDLGAGDGRMYPVLDKIPHTEITACDISEEMLKKYPKGAKKIQANLEENFPIEDNKFDLAFSFFTLEHIKNIEHFFSETNRILTQDGILFLGHFFQRREFERTANKTKFKIQQYKRTSEEIQEIAESELFTVEKIPMTDKGIQTGDLIICRK